MEKSVVVSKDFYSNCLIEAVKAKLINWKTTKFIFIPKKYNTSGTCHFIWKNLNTNELYEFVSLKEGRVNLLRALFEKGHIIRTPWERHNRFVQLGVQRKVLTFERKLEKKMDFVSINVENQKIIDKHNWHGFENPTDDGFIVCMIDNLPKIFKVKDLQIINLENSKVVEWDDIPLTKWKYI